MRQCRRKQTRRTNDSLFVMPSEDRQKVLNEIAEMLHAMPSARDLFEEALSKAQQSGFSFDKEIHVNV